MRAAVFEEFGPPEVLRLRDAVPDPSPGEGEAVVRVGAVGINHVDIDIRSGVSRLPIPLPWILGTEFAGEVVDVRGTAPAGVRVGSRVAVLRFIPCWNCTYCHSGRDNQCLERGLFGISRPGGYAEYVAVPARNLLPLPDYLSVESAAAAQVGFSVAWHVLITRGGLRAGETALINAAGSGVGSAGLQVARLAGARVIATASSAEKLERTRPYADVLIDYSEEDWVDRVLEHTDGLGPHVVLSPAGGEEFLGSFRAVRRDGRIVVVGAHAGEVVPFDLIECFRRQVQIIGSSRATWEEIRTVMSLVGEGRLVPVVDRVLPLADAAEAHRAIEARQVFGKVLLTP